MSVQHTIATAGENDWGVAPRFDEPHRVYKVSVFGVARKDAKATAWLDRVDQTVGAGRDDEPISELEPDDRATAITSVVVQRQRRDRRLCA
eukprot:SAG11_NODE_13213_length_665_cov_1.150177_1_plen_91_part_00